MAKKTTSRSKTEPTTGAAPAVAPVPAPAAQPRTRAAAAPKTAKPTKPKTDQIVTKGNPIPTSASPEPSDDEIRVRAYHRYLERGGHHGMEFEDWLEARRDLLKR